jgi:hypothetical protein
MANRTIIDTATITWDFSTPGQAKANLVGGGGASDIVVIDNASVPVLDKNDEEVTL